MGRSKAKKKREHLLRTKGRNVTISRGAACEFSTHERRTMTKQEKLRKIRNKHKKRYLQNQHREDNAFYFGRMKLTPVARNQFSIGFNSCQAKSFSPVNPFLLLGYPRQWTSRFGL
jgi:hypothetical protein